MAQRISRAKARLREVGARFERPGTGESCPTGSPRPPQVLYLVFTEGHTATTGGGPDRRRHWPRRRSG